VTRAGQGRAVAGGVPAALLALLALHRHSRSNLLVLGGSEAARHEVVRAFHDAGLARRGQFVTLHCAREGAGLRRALQLWLLSDGAGANPLAASADGTLYLEAVHALDDATQRQLLALTRRMAAAGADGREALPLRLAVGDAGDLAAAVERRRFSAALFDCLDKIHVDLGSVRRRGAA
jgi:DNA-binding NtrC family response regulator